jgi:hypothetical protein
MPGSWRREIGGMLQGTGTAGGSFERRLNMGCCADDDDDDDDDNKRPRLVAYIFSNLYLFVGLQCQEPKQNAFICRSAPHTFRVSCRVFPLCVPYFQVNEDFSTGFFSVTRASDSKQLLALY